MARDRAGTGRDRPLDDRLRRRDEDLRAERRRSLGGLVRDRQGRVRVRRRRVGLGQVDGHRLPLKELDPTSGRIFVAGRDLGRLPRRKVSQLRRNVACVFQDFKLLPNRTTAENVAYALKVQGENPDSIRRKVPEVLDLVGLAHKMNSYPDDSPAASSSASRSRARSSTTRRSSSATSRPGTSTRTPRSGSCSCSTGSTARARPSSWSRMIVRWSTRCAAA